MAPSVDQLGLDLGPGIGTLMRRYYPLLLRRAYGDAEEMLAVDLAFDVDNPLIQTLLDELALQVREITETTRADIQGLVGQQAAQGWSVEELAAQLRARGVTESRRRSELIARTETARAYSKGSLLAYEESGVVTGVEWLVTEPCEICAPLAGKVVAMGEPFAEGIYHPPAHPACKCALSPVV